MVACGAYLILYLILSHRQRDRQRQTDRGSAPQIRGDTIRYDMDKMMMMMIRSGGIWNL
jgi:hypothetical protein